jgi:hypothetical protein
VDCGQFEGRRAALRTRRYFKTLYQGLSLR